MLVSYHNHTTWSDGHASLAEQIDAAAHAGIGVSEGDRRQQRQETAEHKVLPRAARPLTTAQALLLCAL